MNTQLVIVDPQHDFCDPSGALYVDGAERDMERLAIFVRKATPVLDDIHVSLDSHQDLHIAYLVRACRIEDAASLVRRGRCSEHRGR